MQNPTDNRPITNTLSFVMLGLLVVIWGFNWPVLKMTLIDIPPLWLATLRMAIGTVCLFAWLLLIQRLRLPHRRDLPIILSVGLLQMAAFLSFTNFGLMYVAVGRSAVLAYTTPLWVVPMAVFIFKERLSLLKGCGLTLGLIGVILLFNPLGFNWHDRNTIIGNGLLILAALAWAICIVHLRFTRWHLSPLQLMPWQMLIATVILFIFSTVFEPHVTIHWSLHLMGLLFYIGPIATVLGYWMIIEISRHLPSITTSLCMLGVPVLGVMAAHFVLGEALQTSLLISMLFIVAGLIFVVKATPATTRSREQQK